MNIAEGQGREFNELPAFHCLKKMKADLTLDGRVKVKRGAINKWWVDFSLCLIRFCLVDYFFKF